MFNKFFIRLDIKPNNWEEHITLFAGYLVNEKLKSSTIKSYVSAIKVVLVDNNITVLENRYILNSLTKACRVINDQVHLCLPIQKDLVNLLLSTIEDHFLNIRQVYLVKLYLALLSTTYYGLFCIGEVTDSQHSVKASDVHIAKNKNKILFILHSSKKHDLDQPPQTIKITSLKMKGEQRHAAVANCLEVRSHCPYVLLQNYLNCRKKYKDDDENFFIFLDGSAVKPQHFHFLLKCMLQKLQIDDTHYQCHGLHAGRAMDLLKYGLSVETIKKIGHWKSNAVYAYLRQ